MMNLQQNILLSRLNYGPKLLNANVIKWIAMITMLIDHVGAGILERGFTHVDYTTSRVDYVLRMVGRTAFPLYCFLLVEGYEHTSNKVRYICNMLLFGLISEIPFDYCFFGRIYLQYQNVFFTLLLGLMAIHMCRWLEEYDIPARIIFEIMTFCVTAAMAEVLHTDYSWKGIALIAVMYFFRKVRILQCLLGALAFSYEPTSVVAFVLMYLYDGTRKKGVNKYVFYAIYPIHLTIYYFVFGLAYRMIFG